ncbi:hypothetical protein [Bacillus sp. FDAARGOS_1420]|uniref:hypothetical protein n=1 Tax=Bacillus sp. FDAARGOS_1420 TaxID=2856338 RepID=UPI001C5AB93B|nr:hypothetical protein [Bacillus sp. FDAARGOS_1420]MBW3496894.1 hypothetical protein [Bacillus sp. FDAARGOS_1420]MBW3496907.1 hypothetical protein [Bacillus sp. FDAARGOS_1420]
MEWSSHQCECEKCKKQQMLTPERLHQFHGVKEGDWIKIFSSGKYIGSGVFLGIEKTMIIWIDRQSNKNITNINNITIKKMTSGYEHLKNNR